MTSSLIDLSHISKPVVDFYKAGDSTLTGWHIILDDDTSILFYLTSTCYLNFQAGHIKKSEETSQTFLKKSIEDSENYTTYYINLQFPCGNSFELSHSKNKHAPARECIVVLEINGDIAFSEYVTK